MGYLEELAKTGLVPDPKTGKGVKYPLRQTVEGMGDIIKGSGKAINQGVYDITGGVALGLDAGLNVLNQATGIGFDPNYFKEGVMSRYEGVRQPTTPAPAVDAPAPVAQVPPSPALEGGGFLGNSGMSPNGPDSKSPVVVANGEVKANPRYGMPESPYVTRRGLAERLGAITGGAVPDSMEGFMVANFMQNQLRQDDAAMVGDNKDIFEAELGALPNFMQADYKRQMMPAEQAKADAYSLNAQTQASIAPSTIDRNTAAAMKLRKEAESMLTRKEKLTKEDQNFLTELAGKQAIEELKMSYGGDASLIPPDMIGQKTMAILSGLMQGKKRVEEGKVPKYTPGVPGEENYIMPDVPEQQAAMQWYLPS
jgi:hypothetical protein